MTLMTLAILRFDQFNPPWLWAMIILAAVGVLALGYSFMYRRSQHRVTWVMFAMRLLALAALLLALVKPSWHSVLLRKERPTVAVILDTSQSMSLAAPKIKASPSTANTSRYSQAVHWLTDSRSAAKLRKQFHVDLFDIAGEPLKRNDLPDQPQGEQTDLHQALTAVASHERGQHMAGIILISDGRNTNTDHQMLDLKDLNMPTYALGFGQPGGAARRLDIAVTQVKAPKRVLVHNSAAIVVTLRKDGGKAVRLPIKIALNGKTLITKRISLRAGQVEKKTTIQYTPDHAGDFVLTADASLPAGDRVPINNTRPFKLHVDAKPIRVMYIEGELRPEYMYLRQRLRHDPDVDLISFVRTATGQITGPDGSLLNDRTINAKRLKKVDVVLLGDIDASMLSTKAYDAIETWVKNGGGLMILGGYHNFSANGLGTTPLNGLLPANVEKGIAPIDSPFHMALTAAGQHSTALAITGDGEKDARLWQSLPPLLAVVVPGTAKPGATVLARDPAARNSETGKGYPVLIQQPFGKGQVVLITADSTWRWSRLVRLTGRPDTLYVRFWSQMIRMLAKRSHKPNGSALSIQTNKVSYQRGEPVMLTVTEDPAHMLPAESGQTNTLSLSVHRPDGRVAQLPVAQSPSNPRRFTARFVPEHGGRFTVAANLTRAGQGATHTIANQQTHFLVAGSAVEMADPSPSPKTLRQIARITNGGYAPLNAPAKIQSMLDHLRATPYEMRRVEATELWDSPLLLIVFIGLITGEWILRRRNRLV